MLTGFQALLNQAETFLETGDPGTIRLSAHPGVDIAANVGEFKFTRSVRDAAFIVIEEGAVVLRRDVLTAVGIETEPQVDDELTIGDKTYRIERVWPGAASFTLDCMSADN